MFQALPLAPWRALVAQIVQGLSLALTSESGQGLLVTSTVSPRLPHRAAM
jgi:hypothetical protein